MVSISSVQVAVDGGSYLNASGTSNWSFNLNSASLANGAHSLIAKVNNTAGKSPQLLVDVTVNNSSTASDCTLFASPSGNDSNPAPPAAPNLLRRRQRYSAGSVLCLLAVLQLSSSFTLPTAVPLRWIVYKNYDSTPSTSSIPAPPMPLHLPHHQGGSFLPGPCLPRIPRLNLNGQGNSGDAFWCAYSSPPLISTPCTIPRSGVATRDCDYLTADHNLVLPQRLLASSTSVPQWYGWTSGISFNSNQWFDNYPGFHNIISNNIVVVNSTVHQSYRWQRYHPRPQFRLL